MTNDQQIARGVDPSSRFLKAIHPKVVERLGSACSSPLFDGLAESEFIEIASCSFLRSFARDELLFAQGQPVRNLILLQSGSVKHTQVSSSGNEVLIRINGEGDVVSLKGESVSCGHSCSARAMENCKALIWEYSRIQTFLAIYPKLRRNASRILASEIQELEERFREIATEKVANRLALLLIRLLRQIGKPSDEGIQISLRREELAQMTGATVFTISRLLSEWSDRGLVLSRREAIVVSDPSRLSDV